MLCLAPDAGALLSDLRVYRAAPLAVLRRAPFEPMTAIFDKRSGATHVVADVVPVILDALLSSPADVAALAARLDLDHGDLNDLNDRLDELVATGLVEIL